MLFLKIKVYIGSILLLIFTVCGVILMNAQNVEAYNNIYRKAYLEISQNDSPRALKIADSLYSVSETPRFKAKSLMLSATLLQQSGEIKRAVEYATKAEMVLSDTDEFTWKAKISGFLSSQYRHLRLFDQSKIYIDETLASIKMIEDKRLSSQMMGFVMQEKAYYDIEFEDYHQSIKDVGEAQKYFDLSGQTDPFLIANNEQLLGLSQYHLGSYDRSLEFYRKALGKLENMPDNFLKAMVLNGIAQVYIEKKNMPDAKKYLDKAEKIARESPFLSLKNAVYETGQQYYAETKDLGKLQEATIKKDSIAKKISTNSSKFIDESYSKLEKKNKEVEQETVQKNYSVFVLLALLSTGLLYFYFYRKMQREKFEKINKIIENQEKANVTLDKSIISGPISDDVHGIDSVAYKVGAENNVMMTGITEKKILAKLEKFEQSTLFTKSVVSLPYLASYCNTNTKYLSYVVNHYKKKDFNNYINELRVNYIIEKLTTDSMYQKYKISTLAEEAGFSSQSKFAASFKKVTSVSPSEFLTHLKKQALKL